MYFLSIGLQVYVFAIYWLTGLYVSKLLAYRFICFPTNGLHVYVSHLLAYVFICLPSIGLQVYMFAIY